MTDKELNQYSLDFRKENFVNPMTVFRATGSELTFYFDFRGEMLSFYVRYDLISDFGERNDEYVKENNKNYVQTFL